MAFSSNLINESQYLQTITDGDFDSIWDHCKDVIAVSYTHLRAHET